MYAVSQIFDRYPTGTMTNNFLYFGQTWRQVNKITDDQITVDKKIGLYYVLQHLIKDQHEVVWLNTSNLIFRQNIIFQKLDTCTMYWQRWSFIYTSTMFTELAAIHMYNVGTYIFNTHYDIYRIFRSVLEQGYAHQCNKPKEILDILFYDILFLCTNFSSFLRLSVITWMTISL